MECRVSSVEEFWKSLKAKGGSVPSAGRSNWNSFSIKDSSKPSRMTQAEPFLGATKETRKHGPNIDSNNETKDEGVGNNGSEVHGKEQSGIDFTGEDHFNAVHKHVNSLGDPNQGVRYAALLSLRRILSFTGCRRFYHNPDAIYPSSNFRTIAFESCHYCIGGRPCLGSRIMVKHCFSVLLNAINADMQGWQSEPKELAAELLYILLNFVEDNATMHLQALIVMLIRVLGDPIIQKKVEKCANRLGYFVSPSAYLPILLPRVIGEINPDVTADDIGRALKILSWAMQGSRPSLITCHIPDICSAFTENHLMTSIQKDINESIITVSELMIRAWTDNCKNEVLPILWLLLNAAAAAVFCGKSSNQADLVLQSLAESSGYKSVENMMTTHVESLLDIMPLPQYWSPRSLDALIFCRLIEQSHLSSHHILQRLIAFSQDVVQHAVDAEIRTRCYCEALEGYNSRQDTSR